MCNVGELYIFDQGILDHWMFYSMWVRHSPHKHDLVTPLTKSVRATFISSQINEILNKWMNEWMADIINHSP